MGLSKAQSKGDAFIECVVGIKGPRHWAHCQDRRPHMVTISKSIASVLAAAITLGTASFGAFASETTNSQVFKAARGVSLDVGSKKVAGYYLSKDGICDVTLMVADLPDADGHVSADISRINLPIKAGSNARVYTSEGKALSLTCSTGTKLMTLRPLEETAAVVKK